MSNDTDAKLVRMANQIASFFATQPGDGTSGAIQHITDFWDPRMRSRMGELLAEGLADGLTPEARAVVAVCCPEPARG